jgi:hypothetical protein
VLVSSDGRNFLLYSRSMISLPPTQWFCVLPCGPPTLLIATVPRNLAFMEKQTASIAGVDLKQFFEASVDALQNAGHPAKSGDRAARRSSALVERGALDMTLRTRALTDAARALSTLWKTNLKRPI